MSDNNKYSVEDFWPDAEKLLDDHFNKIPFWKRYLKHFLITFSVVAVAISVFLCNYSALETSKTTQEINVFNADDTTQDIYLEEQLSPSSQENSNDTPINPSDNSSYTESLTTRNKNNSEDQTPQNAIQTDIIKTDNQAKSADLDVSSKDDLRAKTFENINASSSSSNESSGKAINANQEVEDSSTPIITAESPSNEGNSFQLNSGITSPEPKQSIKETENANVNSSENSYSSADVVADEVTFVQDAHELSNNTIKEIPSVKSMEDSDSNKSELISIPLFTKRLNIETLKSQSFNEFLNAESLSSSELSLEHSEIILPKNKRKNISMRYELNASAFYLSKKLTSGSYFYEYVDRRNAEEGNLISMSYGLGAEIQINRFGIFTGIDVMNYGEKITYQNWLYGNVDQVSENEVYISDSILTPYYNYIQGNEYEFFETTYQTDTLITYDTSQVQAQVAGDVTNVNTSTRLSYIEIPLGLSYSIPLNGRFKVGLRAGMSIGFLRELKGYYIDPLLTEFIEIKDLSIVNSTIFNSRLAVDLNYYLRPGLSVFVRPEWRSNLNSVFIKNVDISQRYNAVGITFGVSKSF